MARGNREYDWLDDPFDEKKSASSMGHASKTLVGLGCLAALVLMIVLVVVALSGIVGVASSI